MCAEPSGETIDAALRWLTRSFACGAQPSIGLYNFGSPRVGNSAFVRRYNRLVPDSWRVLNPRDMVTPPFSPAPLHVTW